MEINSATKTITTDAKGQATMAISKAPGLYTAKITVKKAIPKITAKAKTFKKSVKTKNSLLH